MSNLRNRIIRLAYENPDLRGDLLPLLKQAGRKQYHVTVRTDERNEYKVESLADRYDGEVISADYPRDQFVMVIGFDTFEDGDDFVRAAVGKYDVSKVMGTLERSMFASSDPADKSYDLISKHKGLKKHLQKKLDDLAKTMERVSRNVEGADVYGGKHLAALDLMKSQVIPALERFRDEVDQLVDQAKKATVDGRRASSVCRSTTPLSETGRSLSTRESRENLGDNNV